MLTETEAYHMLHCLYSIYKHAHPDFYGDDPSGPAWIVKHTDHCVDNLRQVRMGLPGRSVPALC